jgi:alkylated DNA nucleotide flippase Atl1
MATIKQIAEMAGVSRGTTRVGKVTVRFPQNKRNRFGRNHEKEKKFRKTVENISASL